MKFIRVPHLVHFTLLVPKTPDDVRACFGAFGALTDSVIIGDGTIRRGFGFVTFGTYSVCDAQCARRRVRFCAENRSNFCENIGNSFAIHVKAYSMLSPTLDGV
jgi:hypothetical protein